MFPWEACSPKLLNLKLKLRLSGELGLTIIRHAIESNLISHKIYLLSDEDFLTVHVIL